jgi:hypothetical protein
MDAGKRPLRVLALSKQGTQLRAVVARRNDAMWVFGGDDPTRLNYVQSVWLWADSFTAPEPTTEEVADAVASFGKQRTGDR